MSVKQPLLVIWWPEESVQNRAEESGQIPVVRYEVLSPLGQHLSRGEEALNRLPSEMPCLVLLSPSEVSTLSIDAPSISGKKLKEALPFLVEPQLLNDPEDNHVSLFEGLMPQSSQQLVSVTAKTRIRSVAALCRQLSISPIGISSELLLKANAPRVRRCGQCWILFDPASPPVAVPLDQPGLLKALLTRKLAQRTTEQAAAFECSASDAELLTPWVQEGLCRVSEQQPEPLTALASRPLCSLDELRKLGLKNTSNANEGWKQLARPAAVLLLTLVVGINVLAIKERQNEEAIDKRIAEIYSKALPSTPMVADPLLLIEREKRNLTQGTQKRQGDGLSYLIHEAGLAMDDAPFNSLNSIQLDKGVLSLGFSPNLTEDQQQAAINRLKVKNIKAKWVQKPGAVGPTLELSGGGL